MSVELETRLEELADALPHPSTAVTAGARSRALAGFADHGTPVRAGRRRRRVGMVALAAAAVVVALAVVSIAPWTERSPLATERALAALGDLPVIHAVVEPEVPSTTVVDLRTGAEREEVRRTEYWFDEQRALLRAQTTIEGAIVADVLQTRQGTTTENGPMPRLTSPFLPERTGSSARDPQLDPALTEFASHYRESLASGTARVAGRGSVAGRAAIFLRLEPSTVSAPRDASPRRVVEEVAVDAETFRPLRFRYLLGASISPWWRVITIGTVARAEGQFAPPRLSANPIAPFGQTGFSTSTATTLWSDGRMSEPPEPVLAQAAKVLGRPVAWPGARVAGVALLQVDRLALTTFRSGAGTGAATGRQILLSYGPGRTVLDNRWLAITEERLSDQSARLAASRYPELRPGELRIGRGDHRDGAHERWSGTMVVRGLSVELTASSRELLLAAARATDEP